MKILDADNMPLETMELISVIIPTYNEEAAIGPLLSLLERRHGIEVIVADGGSTDDTLRIAARYPVTVVNSTRERAQQLNRGVEAAQGDILLFLHADSEPPVDFTYQIAQALDLPRAVGGAFALSIDSSQWLLRWVSELANFRSRMFHMPYGDQGIFLRRSVLEQLGGFAEIPIMEDFDFVRRLKRLGRVVHISTPMKTSARRWKKEGVLRTLVRNQLLIMLYYCAVDPARLERFRFLKADTLPR